MSRLLALALLCCALPAHAYVTFVGHATSAADNADFSTDPTSITPPSLMAANDYVVVLTCARTISLTWTVSTTGGQSWTSDTAASGSTRSCQVHRALFNGTWGANPAFDASATPVAPTVLMLVFRGVDTTTPLETATTTASFTSASCTSGACTVAPADTTTANALVLTCWFSIDANPWQLPSGSPLSQPTGLDRLRNQNGSNGSLSCAWKVQPTAGDPGNFINDQDDGTPSVGTDDGLTTTLALRASTTMVPCAPGTYDYQEGVGSAPLNAPTPDAELAGGPLADSIFGNSPASRLGDLSGIDYRMLTSWTIADLALMTDATISAASVTLNLESSTGATAGTAARMLRDPWNELTTTWNRYASGSLWTTAGCASDGNDFTSTGAVATTPPGSAGAWTTTGFAALVQDALASRNGILRLRWKQTDEATSDTSMQVSMGEDTTASERPKLSITVTCPSVGGPPPRRWYWF